MAKKQSNPYQPEGITKPDPPPDPPQAVKKITVDDYGLPAKELFRIDEVATYFCVSERCIRLWIQHGHLVSEKIMGILRVTRASIIACRFRKNE